MESSRQKRRKITLLFLLGVGLPSLVLGYLAFRGIRNELALLEQRRLGQHRAVAQVISDTIADEITATELAVARALAGHGTAPSDNVELALTELKRQQPLVDEVFYFDRFGTVQLPAADLLYYPDGSQTLRPDRSWPAAVAPQWRTAQQQEFQQRRYLEAQASYRRAFASVSDPVLRGEALVAVARVQRKAGQLEAALTSCESLVNDYSDVRTTAGLPVGPVAHLERGSLLLATGDTTAALDAFLALYEGLTKAEWTLDRAQFHFFASQAGDSIASTVSRSPAGAALDSYRDSLARLEERQSEREARTERLLLFQETAAEDLRTRLVAESEGADPRGRRFTLEVAGQTYLVSLLDAAGGGRGVWGLLLDAGALSDFLRRALEDHLDPATSDWLVKGRDGRPLLGREASPAGPITLNATFADNFPPWLIEFYQRPQSAYRRLFASSQSIYFYMFLLIASILVFGLVLTVRAVRHELELARLKSDFVSTVSHEFKSPLTSIRHLAEMLQAGSVPSEERRSRYYDVLVEQSARLSSLVTNILDLARIEEGRKEFQIEKTDVGDVVRDLVTTTQQRVGHEGCVVEAHIEEPLPKARADRTAIAQAISNLVENAIQYSGETKQVNVSVSTSDGWVDISVADSGVGIPGNEIDKVFDRFYRGGHPLTRSVKGSGLGLTLVNEIVQAHRGTVTVESEPGRGSTFTIKLPAEAEQDDATDPDS
jgi:signal transduction histidine kinase